MDWVCLSREVKIGKERPTLIVIGSILYVGEPDWITETKETARWAPPFLSSRSWSKTMHFYSTPSLSVQTVCLLISKLFCYMFFLRVLFFSNEKSNQEFTVFHTHWDLPDGKTLLRILPSVSCDLELLCITEPLVYWVLWLDVILSKCLLRCF